VGASPGLARVSPDGGTVVVSNRGDNTVSLIDAQQLTVRSTIPACQQPEDIAVLPDSSKAFVACAGSGQVASIDLKSDKLLALLDVGKTPVHLALKPDGIFLSNGPGDPAATGEYAVPVIRALIEQKPVFGICLGHQMLGLAVGAKTMKMHQGHHGANHPVKDETTGKVEITSMNHGFAVDQATLPKGATQTHISLFDGSNCGIQLEGKPVFSVQYHPEASPGPRDSHGLFRRFVGLMREFRRG